MIKPIFLSLMLSASVAACASAPKPYQPASSERAVGFSETQIEADRFYVSYRGSDAVQARSYALRRAAELTLNNGADWFHVVRSSSEAFGSQNGPSRPSVSVGGTYGSGGYSNVGVGVGINLGSLGGGNREVSQHLEIITGAGAKPEGPQFYDARSVVQNTF